MRKHLAKHIDGQPPIIVQNKDGAGGLVGTNYVGEVGPRDGSMCGFFTGAAWKYVIEPEKHSASISGPSSSSASSRATRSTTCAPTYRPGLKAGADILKAQGLVAGGLALESSKDLLIRLTLDMLGVPYKYVTGYRQQRQRAARRAARRDQPAFGIDAGYFNVVEPSLVKTGTVLPIYYDPNYDGETFSVPKVMEGSSVAPFQEFYRKVKGGEPCGPLWDAYRTNLAVDSAMLRTVAMPPGFAATPQRGIARGARAVNNDQEYADETMKAMQFVPYYETGADINARVRKQMSISPEVRTFVVNYMKEAGHK